MNTLPRHFLLLLVCALVLTCVLFEPLAPAPVRADLGVQPILPGGSNIKPEGETQIQMTAEKVVLTVHKTTDMDNGNPQLGGVEYYPCFPVLKRV